MKAHYNFFLNWNLALFFLQNSGVGKIIEVSWRGGLLKFRPLFPNCVNQVYNMPSKYELLDEITYGQDKPELWHVIYFKILTILSFGLSDKYNHIESNSLNLDCIII